MSLQAGSGNSGGAGEKDVKIPNDQVLERQRGDQEVHQRQLRSNAERSTITEPEYNRVKNNGDDGAKRSILGMTTAATTTVNRTKGG